MTIHEYLLSIKDKSVAVVGVGISNTPLIRMLLGAGIKVTACDKKESLGDLGEELTALGCQLNLGESYLENITENIIFRSPGIRPDIDAFQKAVANGSELTSEMEVFFKVCPCAIFAITGSDGKTTTTTLIAEMLKNAGHTVHVGGNIGRPLLPDVASMKHSDFAVLELSSFQLMTMKDCGNVAVMTNLSPNHLDIHTDMNEYRQAKENIFLEQNPEDMMVLNADNEETLAISKKVKSQVLLFSRKPLDKGVFVEDGMIYVSDEEGKEALFPTSDIKIVGEHNVENYLAAIAALWGIIDVDAMRKTALEFGGVEHRIELVRIHDGVTYYNDSIASSPTRTMAGLNSFKEKLILMAGGYDKKIPFDSLGDGICEKVKILVLVGHTANKIEEAVLNSPQYIVGNPEIIKVDSFESAVEECHRNAKNGDTVLFSPACASFDLFPNFDARGKRFKELVMRL